MRKKGLEPLNKKSSLFRLLSKLGWLMVPINSRFVADLKRLADLQRNIDEFDELGKRMKANNSRPRK
ncbi:hypothetical protein [Pedobacter panaciterrae]